MRKASILAAALLLALAACGGDDAGSSNDGTNGDSGGASGGAVVDPQPPGQATVAVDGQIFTLNQPGALACNVTPEEITFSFRLGDNEVTLGAGASKFDSDWLGNISLVVANPNGEQGPIQYFVNVADNGEQGFAFASPSMSYSGPMQKQPANDGSNPPPVDVGSGTVSITCP